MKPLIMAHKGGDCFGHENSIKAIEKTLAHSPDVIELDIRKSLDNILFCYHGNIVEYYFPKLFFYTSFKELKKHYPTLTALSEAAKIINENITLLLDIKDNSLTKKDITLALKNTKIKKVFIASNKLEFHKKIGSVPNSWRKILNIGFLKLSKKKISELIDADVTAVKLFFWDFTDSNIRFLKKYNIDVVLSKRFLPFKIYLDQSFIKKTLWIWDYDIPSLINIKKQFLNDKHANPYFLSGMKK